MGLCLSSSETENKLRVTNVAWKKCIKQFPKWNWGLEDNEVGKLVSVSTSTQITLTKLQEIETEKSETKKARKKSTHIRGTGIIKKVMEVTPSQKRELEAKISNGAESLEKETTGLSMFVTITEFHSTSKRPEQVIIFVRLLETRVPKTPSQKS